MSHLLSPQVLLYYLILQITSILHLFWLQQREQLSLIILPCLQQREHPHPLQLTANPSTLQQVYYPLIDCLFLPMMLLITYSDLPYQDPPKLSSMPKLQNSYLANLQWSSLLAMCSTKLGPLHSFMAEHQQFFSYSINGTPLVNYFNPAILQSMMNRTDTPTFTEAMSGPDSAGFLKAMELEMMTLIGMKTFDVVKYLSKHKGISSVWVFKVKRFPNGSVN